MTDSESLSAGRRIVRLLDALGITRAHVCARSPLDVLDLLGAAPERIASITLQGAADRLADFGALRGRVLWLLGDQGEYARQMAPLLDADPSANVHWIKGYAEFNWADTVHERGEEVSQVLLDFLDKVELSEQLSPVALDGAGETAGVSYQAGGKGTPVLLLPLGLSAHQWDALLPPLQARHCAIVLAGRHLQPVENLESRAEGDYSRMALSVLDLAQPQAGESLVEVGCGSGALLRRTARKYGSVRIVGLDVNAFLLREASALAEQEGITERLEFKEGSAEAIPLPDETFDIAFSSTVMEELNADQMLAEMVRITKPGGRVCVIVRSVDRDQWTNAPVPAEVRRKVEGYRGGVAAGGCADESLLRRFHDAGLKNLQGGPALAWARPLDGWWKNVELPLRGLLSEQEWQTWQAGIAQAALSGPPVWVARPFHCAVGTK
jgi:SAM-dependent methyltransferase